MGAFSEHFSEKELACKCGCGENGCIQGLVDALEQFRAQAGNLPVMIDDAFRCQKHNAEVGGVKNSTHPKGEAADIKIKDWTGVMLESVARKCSLIKGIGRDDYRNYLHIDIRPSPAQWCYAESGSQMTYYPPKEGSVNS